MTVGQGALEMAVQLIAMILVERRYGQGGLGVYSYLVAFYHLAAYVADFGISRWLERETALQPGSTAKHAAIWRDAQEAQTWSSLAVGFLCCLSAQYDTSHTLIQEKIAAYFIIGIAIPIRNAGKLRLSAMHGLGRHGEVAKLEARKRLFFISILFGGSLLSMSPSYLLLSVLISELVLLISATKRLKLPRPLSLRSSPTRILQTLKQGRPLLFLDQALECVLYIDLVILGVYLPSLDLGIYAETSFMARLFLFAPLSLRPLFRQKYCAAIRAADQARAAQLFRRLSSVLFFVHSLMALTILLFYAETLGTFFVLHGEEQLSLKLFEVMLPGLLLCSTVMISEPLYEAVDEVASLRQLVFVVLLVTGALNVYLVPSFGYHGAATATLAAMTAYYWLFGNGLPTCYRPARMSHLAGSAGAFLVYVVVRSLRSEWPGTPWLLPILTGMTFYCIGFFESGTRDPCIPTKGESS